MLSVEKNRAEIELKKWFEDLNKLKVDEKQWNSIKKQCEQKIAEFKEVLASFESGLLVNEGAKKKEKELAESFHLMAINPGLKPNGSGPVFIRY